MNRTLVEGGLVFTGEEVLAGATVVIDGERVARVIPSRSVDGSGRPGDGPRLPGDGGGRRGEGGCLPRDGDSVVHASGRLVTPGLVNAHTHIYSALARGIHLKDPAPGNFREILERLWWRLDRALGPEEIRLSALLHGIESLRSGVTTIFDHHSSQRSIRGSLATISGALDEIGLRAALCFEVSDREGSDAARDGIEENLSFARDLLAQSAPLRAAHFGLHASFTLSDRALKLCRESLAGTVGEGVLGFHIHLAEDGIDQALTRERHRQSVVERLRQWEILGPRSLCVHGVHLEEREREILAGSGTWLVHCPESNMNNAVGAVRLSDMREAGVRLALGSDGFTANIARECLTAHLLQSHIRSDPRAGYLEVPSLLHGGNAALAAGVFGEGVGKIVEGGPADLVLWDYLPPTPLDRTNLYGHLLFGLVDARASSVWIAGRCVLRHGRVVGVDEDEVIRGCEKGARQLWERL